MTDVTTLSGRDLDRAVAEAKGCGPAKKPEWWWFKHTGTEDVAEAIWPGVGGYSGPEFSRDWAAAGPLLGEMEDEEPELGRDLRGWYVHLYMSDRWFYGDTPTEVIARARVAWKDPR